MVGPLGAMPTALRGHVFERQTDSHAHAKPWAWHPIHHFGLDGLLRLSSIKRIRTPTQSRGRGTPNWALIRHAVLPDFNAILRLAIHLVARFHVEGFVKRLDIGQRN